MAHLQIGTILFSGFPIVGLFLPIARCYLYITVIFFLIYNLSYLLTLIILYLSISEFLIFTWIDNSLFHVFSLLAKEDLPNP